MIPSIRNIDLYKTKIAHIKHLYDDFLKVKVFELANKIILDKIIIKMQELGFSEKIIQNTFVHKNVKITRGQIQFRIVSNYESESGFDVSLAREFGTIDHMVEPKIKKSLHWIENGKSRFSKGHKVSGLEEYRVISNTIREEFPLFRMRLREETQKWINDIMKQ